MKQSVFLCGFMGVGKSTVGKILALKLNVPFYDTDQMICESAGATVAEIFANGEAGFRQLETEEISKFEYLPKGVVALGGGALKDPVNLRAIQKNGILIYLGAEPATLHARLGDSDSRPLLSGHSGAERLRKIGQLLEGREIVYKSADIVVATDGKSAEEVSEEIMQELKRGNLE
jgi:shikimate kinase